MSADEAELRRAVAILEMTRGQVEALARQQEVLRVTLEEVLRARETLRRANEAGAGAEMLMPIGANSFLVGQLKDADRVIVGIGSDVAMDESVGAAVERLDARARAIEEAGRGLDQRMAELEGQAQAQSRLVQELYEKAQGGGTG